MVDSFSLLLGLFIGLFSGLGLGSMLVMLIFVYAKLDFSDPQQEDVSTDDDIEFQHL